MTDFETELVAVQPALIAYINVLCGVPQEVRDILGETNLALVRHRDAYDASRPFLPWARAFALQAVRHWWSGQRREHVVFDDQLLDALDETMARMQDPGESDVSHRLDLLDAARRELTPDMRYLLSRHYDYGEDLETIGRVMGRSPGGLAVALHRLRGVLRRSIEMDLRREKR